MAEVVEMHIEDMIPELELMEKLHIFTKNEIKTITKKRKEFEYKLQRSAKCKDDIFRYIQYETDLMKLVRKKRMDKGVNQKKNNLEYSIANHINKLFNFAIRRFPGDVKIWLSYIKFCKQVRFYTCVSRILDQMLELHGDKPALFKLAAKWEFEECQSIEKARQILIQGLHVHKDSTILYSESFKLELEYADKKRKQKLSDKDKEKEDVAVQGVDKAVLEGKLAEVIYESALKKINDVSFFVELLNIAKKYPFCTTLQNKIIEGLREKFPNAELTWDTLARRELELDGHFKFKVERCVSKYEEGVKQIGSEKMWHLYLDFILELSEDMSFMPNYKRNCLNSGFMAADQAGVLTEAYYLTWVSKCESHEKERILEWGTRKRRDSGRLWQARLEFQLVGGRPQEAMRLFQEAIAIPAVNQPPLWLLIIKYFQATDPSKCEAVWQKAVKDPQVGSALKGRYIEWLTVSRGIVAARKAYNSLATTPPFSLELHRSMANLEDWQPKLSLKHARAVYEMMVHQFGQANTDVWLWYVKFEQKYGDALNVPQIYQRAQRTLRPNLVDIFISDFSLIKAQNFSGSADDKKAVPTFDSVFSDAAILEASSSNSLV